MAVPNDDEPRNQSFWDSIEAANRAGNVRERFEASNPLGSSREPTMAGTRAGSVRTCPRCGTALSAGAAFCSGCGRSVSAWDTDFEFNRAPSTGQRIAVLVALGIGLLCALALPSIKIEASMGLFGGSRTGNIGDLLRGLNNDGRAWSVWVAAIGVIVAVLAAFQLPAESPGPAWVVTLGSLTTLLVPLEAQAMLGDIGKQSANEGLMASGSLSSGLILASLAFIAPAITPWVARHMGQRNE